MVRLDVSFLIYWLSSNTKVKFFNSELLAPPHQIVINDDDTVWWNCFDGLVFENNNFVVIVGLKVLSPVRDFRLLANYEVKGCI